MVIHPSTKSEITISTRIATEWHVNLSTWFKSVAKILNCGVLLVIDYCLHSSSYYNRMRKDGTLLAYRNNVAINNFLRPKNSSDETEKLIKEALSKRK